MSSQNKTFTCDEFNSIFSTARRNGSQCQCGYLSTFICCTLTVTRNAFPHSPFLSLSVCTQYARLSTCTFEHCVRLGRGPLSLCIFPFLSPKTLLFCVALRQLLFSSCSERAEREKCNELCRLFDSNMYLLLLVYACKTRMNITLNEVIFDIEGFSKKMQSREFGFPFSQCSLVGHKRKR